MRIDIVYFDMDSVLVNLEKALARHEGLSMNDFKKKHDEINAKGGDYIMDCVEKYIGKGCFEWAEPMPDYHTGMALMYDLRNAGYRVEILSSASKRLHLYDRIVDQKRIWLDKYGLDSFHAHFAKGGSTKYKFATENSLLIDDWTKNCEQFVDAGGHAIEHKNFKTTIKLMESFNIQI